jgi:hypothetical protein
MSQGEQRSTVPAVIKRKPVQAGKFIAILLVLVLGIGGFLRVISAEAIVNDPLLGDGQFLALVFVPLLGLGLMLLVFLESLVAGYRVLRSDASISDQVTGRWGYLLIRGAEAGTAIVGVMVVFATLPLLFAETTPAPAGVGLLLVLFVVGLGVLFIGFVRSSAELFVYDNAA